MLPESISFPFTYQAFCQWGKYLEEDTLYSAKKGINFILQPEKMYIAKECFQITRLSDVIRNAYKNYDNEFIESDDSW